MPSSRDTGSLEPGKREFDYDELMLLLRAVGDLEQKQLVAWLTAQHCAPHNARLVASRKSDHERVQRLLSKVHGLASVAGQEVIPDA